MIDKMSGPEAAALYTQIQREREPLGEWLDPEPAEHREMDCRERLPALRRSDLGRRWACRGCNRAYRVADSQRDGLYWALEPV